MTDFLAEWAASATRIETQKRRLEALRFLAKIPGYRASASLIRHECHRLGVPTTSDQMIGALTWLDENDLVALEGVEDAIVARLTPLGRDVASGQKLYPGVLRPDP
ncbi:hypothetical protein SAMN05421853_10295 [Roseivivax halotolerans]|uniref:Uncharacterized protein n=1 Tax=Roseivivax halotolerans TaxID=93684 RepID=A0A1I5W2X1_9RHOB|nr:hypothetical protein [Roseivivax halotolerans]SFQ14092.1 hypothetical protein SAMN05421853_10295 [Roseivivax halotolerans]